MENHAKANILIGDMSALDELQKEVTSWGYTFNSLPIMGLDVKVGEHDYYRIVGIRVVKGVYNIDFEKVDIGGFKD